MCKNILNYYRFEKRVVQKEPPALHSFLECVCKVGDSFSFTFFFFLLPCQHHQTDALGVLYDEGIVLHFKGFAVV